MSGRLPIAVWVSSFGAGGTERQMVHLIGGLDPDLFEVHAACFYAGGAWLDAATERAASIAEFPMHRFWRPHTWRQIGAYAEWCRRHSIAAVITSDFYTNVFGLTGAALAGVPVRIGGRREINTDKGPAKLLLQRAAYSLAHCIVTNSKAAAARLRREGVRERLIRIVSNGVSIPESRADKRQRILRAITVANLRPEKGHDLLIDAIALRPELRSMRFDFAGDGPCRAALEARARVRGVAHQVAFLGERSDVPTLLEQADLFVLPSRTEALPNSVMEAMASGLPVLATDVGGVPELIESGVTGILVPPGNASALADGIVQIASNPARASALGSAARAFVSEHFSMSRMVAGFTDTLIAELSRRGTTVAVRAQPSRV